MNSDHKPKLVQSDLVYWVIIGDLAYIAVLPAELVTFTTPSQVTQLPDMIFKISI